MTPKEKADQLYAKMKFQTEYNSLPSTVKGMCKELALICIDEKIETLLPYAGLLEIKGHVEELEEIEKEIQKL